MFALLAKNIQSEMRKQQQNLFPIRLLGTENNWGRCQKRVAVESGCCRKGVKSEQDALRWLGRLVRSLGDLRLMHCAGLGGDACSAGACR